MCDKKLTTMKNNLPNDKFSSNASNVSQTNGHHNHLVDGSKQMKSKRINKCDLGPNFVAPDGGWGWLVVIAAGTSNLCTFPVLQQFGLLFAERLKSIGLTTSQITTIINLNSCLTSCVGLINGPMFRRFSYRQVGLFGALLVALSIYTLSVSNSFLTYLITFSFLYGVGSGINSSANSLALNTYFKEKRRIATGLSWTITGMGPIIMPQIIAIILPLYDVQGSLLIYTGLALNAVVCALIFQPVQWHVKHSPKHADDPIHSNVTAIECDFCSTSKRKNQTVFSSQYLYNADNASVTGYEIIDPGIPMLSLANDGWSSRRSLHGSRASLYSNRPSRFGSRIASSQNLVGSNRPSSANLSVLAKDREKRKISEIKIEEHPEVEPDENFKLTTTWPTVKITIGPPTNENKYLSDNHSALSINKNPLTPYRKKSTMNTFNVEKEVLKGASQKLEEFVSSGKRVPTFTSLDNFCTCEEQRQLYLDPKLPHEYHDDATCVDNKCFSIWEKIVIFFDLDLLRDLTYVNLMMGVTLGNFAELNFSILTPFVLADWGFDKQQIATAMSLLGGIDISVRFFIPFIAGKIGWENKTFFLVGIMGMAMGRVFITFFQSYVCILIAFCWIGLGKGLRTVFMALVIPSHVPLHRLPGASGLQLLFAGIFYFVMGPIVGYIRDRTNYIVTLHCLNIATYFVATCWIAEKFYRSYQERVEKKKIKKINCDSQKANIN